MQNWNVPYDDTSDYDTDTKAAKEHRKLPYYQRNREEFDRQEHF